MASLKQILTFGTPSELSTLVKDEQNPLLPHSRLNVLTYQLALVGRGGARGGAWPRHFFSHQTLFCGAYKEIKSEIEGRGILRTSPSPSTV